MTRWLDSRIHLIALRLRNKRPSVKHNLTGKPRRSSNILNLGQELGAITALYKWTAFAVVSALF